MSYLINFTAIAAVIYFGIAFVGFIASYDFAKAQVSQASPEDIGEPEDLEEPPGSAEASSITVALHQSVDAGLLYRLGRNVFCTNRAWASLGATSRQQVLSLLLQIIEAIDYIPLDTLWLDEQQYLTCLGPFDWQGPPSITLMTIGEWHQSLNARALPAGRFEAAA